MPVDQDLNCRFSMVSSSGSTSTFLWQMFLKLALFTWCAESGFLSSSRFWMNGSEK